MQGNRIRGGMVAIAFVLVIAACGDDGVLGPGVTETTGVATTETTEPPGTSEAPPETSEAPPETVAGTTTTTTTESPATQCEGGGGVSKVGAQRDSSASMGST